MKVDLQIRRSQPKALLGTAISVTRSSNSFPRSWTAEYQRYGIFTRFVVVENTEGDYKIEKLSSN